MTDFASAGYWIILAWLLEYIRVEIRAALGSGFVFFYRDAMSLCVSVVANAGDLPRHFHIGFATGNLEAIVLYFLSDEERSKTADAGQLITEITIERLKIIRQADAGFASAVQGYNAIIDILHIGRFNEGMRQGFIFRIKRVVNFERTSRFGERTGNADRIGRSP